MAGCCRQELCPTNFSLSSLPWPDAVVRSFLSDKLQFVVVTVADPVAGLLSDKLQFVVVTVADPVAGLLSDKLQFVVVTVADSVAGALSDKLQFVVATVAGSCRRSFDKLKFVGHCAEKSPAISLRELAGLNVPGRGRVTGWRYQRFEESSLMADPASLGGYINGRDEAPRQCVKKKQSRSAN